MWGLRGASGKTRAIGDATHRTTQENQNERFPNKKVAAFGSAARLVHGGGGDVSVGHYIDLAGRPHAIRKATFEAVLHAMSDIDPPMERRRGERRTAERRQADRAQSDRRLRGRRLTDRQAAGLDSPAAVGTFQMVSYSIGASLPNSR